MTQHTQQPVSDQVLDAMGKMARQHMRAHGMQSTRAVSWLRAQERYEFASIGRFFDEAALDRYLANANRGSTDKAGLIMLRRTRGTKGRVFIAFTEAYVQHVATQLQDQP